MGLKKGSTNNPKGRPKGVPNKITKTVREALKDFVQSEIKKLPQTCKEMSPYERGVFFLKVLEFAIPRADKDTVEEKKPIDDWTLNFALRQIATEDKDGKIRRVFE